MFLLSRGRGPILKAALGPFLLAAAVSFGQAPVPHEPKPAPKPAAPIAPAAPLAPAAPQTVVMLSDIHLDPYYDPAKFTQLASVGAKDWDAVFAQSDSATLAADRAKLAAACPVRGVDTPPALFASSLRAAHEADPGALFVTVSGDLLAHSFDCRFKLLAPQATEADYAAFAVKTAAFVAQELRRTFGATPVYVALGNNDSGCGDYRESSESPFLMALAANLAGPITTGQGRQTAERQFSTDGDYSVRLPALVVRGRIVVLQDLFESVKYQKCDGTGDAANAGAAAAQIAWLRRQLEHARQAHEQVWVMAHIPPGVNVYSTAQDKRNVCAGEAPDMFLAGDELVKVLTSFGDVVRLTLFGHTHNDEMHLLRPEPGAPAGAQAVVMKQVPSISPVNGNLPAFTVGELDPQTAVLNDFRVAMASNSTGSVTGNATKWSEEYQFSKLYGMRGYTPANVAKLLDGFVADHEGLAQKSTDYQQQFSPGGGRATLAVHFIWPSYSCSTENHTAASYRTCLCPAK